MKLRHATPTGNLESILSAGLQPDRSRGKRKAVWLHSPSKTTWAILHTMKNHAVTMEAITVIELDVPRSWLVRAQKGLWRCARVIEPERIRQVTEATAWAASPVNDNE